MRSEINENELNNIAGGKIQFTYDNGSGTIWIAAKNKKEYSFTNYGVVDLVTNMQNNDYSDQEIIDYMLSKGYIW